MPRIRRCRAAAHAGGIRAVQAPERQVKPGHADAPLQIEGVHLPPTFVLAEAVFDAAGKQAGVTAGTAIQVQQEASH
jgi:hypothetical protein